MGPTQHPLQCGFWESYDSVTNLKGSAILGEVPPQKSHHSRVRSQWDRYNLPSGKRWYNYGKSPFLMRKSTMNIYKLSFSIANCWHNQRVPRSFFSLGHTSIPTPSWFWAAELSTSSVRIEGPTATGWLVHTWTYWIYMGMIIMCYYYGQIWGNNKHSLM